MTTAQYNFDWGKTMLQSKFTDLVREKEYREKRRLSLRVIAKEAGLSLTTIARVKNGNMDNLRMSTFDTLGEYFEIASIADLVEFRRSVK